MRDKNLTWRVILFGVLGAAISTAAGPYLTLKLGMGLDLTLAGMFAATVLIGRYAGSRQDLAIQLNIVQTMIGTAGGLSFSVVVMAAFYYIKVISGRDIGFNVSWWQMGLFLLVSGALGVFMGVLPRRMILNDTTLPWPGAQATLSVAETLTDDGQGERNRLRRLTLFMSVIVSGFVNFLKSFGLFETATVGKLGIGFGLAEFTAIGLGMLVPLSVGLSGLLGVWLVSSFGEQLATYSALAGTQPEYWKQCLELVGKVGKLNGDEATTAIEFLKANCGDASKFLVAGSHFSYLVKWTMWPATAMMIASVLTSIAIPFVKKWFVGSEKVAQVESRADEYVSPILVGVGIVSTVGILTWMTSRWFDVPWQQVAVAILLQPILIIAGLKVLGFTGQGPVSLMANATQFVFGLFWPAHIRGNLTAAFVSASPQASSEGDAPSFWVARRLGGKFATLVVAQLVALPVVFLVPLAFVMLERTYGIGLNPGQLSAPTGLKIATLALVMEKGVSALPHGALTASVIAIGIGILFEILLVLRVQGENGAEKQRFSWVPIPSALGFALILPASLSIMTAVGSIISAVWRKYSPSTTDGSGSYDSYAAPIAAGLITGEVIMGGVFIPVFTLLVGYFSSLF